MSECAEPLSERDVSREELLSELQRARREIERLSQSEARLRAISDATKDAIVVLDAHGRVIHWNEAAWAMFGRTGEEVLGRELHTLLIPERSRAAYRRGFAAFRETGEGPVVGETLELEAIHEDGRELPIELSVSALRLGDEWGAVGIVRDITTRRAAEEELRASESRFRTLFEASPSSTALADLDGTILMCNRQFVALHGRGSVPDDLLGRRIDEVVAEEDHPRLRELIATTIRTGELPQPIELDVLRGDGTRFPAEVSCAAVLDDEGRPLALLGQARDVSERRRAETKRRALEAQVQQAQKLESLGALASGIAHDFNNLLVGLSVNVDLALLDVPEGSPAREHLARAKTSAARAADLVDQIFASAGGSATRDEQLDLNDLVREEVALRRPTLPPDLVLQLELQDDLSALRGDPTQMRQVIANLVSNAAEAVGEGPGEVVVRTASARGVELGGRRRDAVTLVVRDTGAGMDAETRARAFDPFFSTKFTGRGLGLAVVRGIVQAHEGAIEIEGEPGLGARVTVTLPAYTVGPRRASAPALGDDDADWQGSGAVLLVDDEGEVLRTVQAALEGLGFGVLPTRDGAAAVELFRERADDVSCVLLDLCMPEMDGVEACARLREIRADVPVIISSGRAERESRERFAKAGVSAYLQKPYSIATLRRTLRELLEPA